MHASTDSLVNGAEAAAEAAMSMQGAASDGPADLPCWSAVLAASW